MIKTLSLVFLISCVAIVCCAQSGMNITRGTVRIGKDTLMKETEVTLKEWMDFIVNNDFDESLFPDNKAITNTTKVLFDDLRKQQNFEYLKVVSHGNGKLKEVEAVKKFNELAGADSNYFSILVPITGITFEQAQRFCKWEELIVNVFAKTHVVISLPSVETYKKVIPNIDSLSKNGKCFVLNCSTARCNEISKTHIIRVYKEMMTQGKGLEKVFSYFPTSLGLYNIQGNAAEMTSTPGIAMGGSFRQTARESYNDKQQLYHKAENWLGFRYIVIIK